MPLYNFEVKETVSFFIQRRCTDDDEAQEMKEKLEREGFVDPSEKMRNTDVESDFDLEVVGGPALNHGTGEA